MVTDILTDGIRIAELLAAELTVDHGPLREVTITESTDTSELTPTVDGTQAYLITGQASNPIADVYVQPDRTYLEFIPNPEAVMADASERDLRVRPKAVDPPRTLVFLENGADVKRVLGTVATAIDTD